MNPFQQIRVMALRIAAVLLSIACCTQTGCQDRVSGQVEAFAITGGKLQRFNAQAPAVRAHPADPGEGEPIRSNDDVVTIQVESAFLHDLPPRLTGSNDVIIFVDVWENAATGYNSPSLTSIVYLGKNQKVPGRFNFRDALAYGPTRYKGHPLRIRFSMMVLQKKQADQGASTIDVIGAFAVTAAPQYGIITSEVAKALQSVLKAQPDIIVFDFEATFLSDQPEGLLAIAGSAQSGGTEQTQWLKYGRFILLESESYDGKTKALKDYEPQKITVDDGWLRFPPTPPKLMGDPVLANYLVVRITPHQLPEDDETLKAAAAANQETFNSLRRSDTEIAAAITGLTSSAQTLGDEILRIKAEKIARAYAGQVQRTVVEEKRSQALADLFNAEWTKVSAALPQARQDSATKVGAAVLARWQAKFSSSNPQPSVDPLAAQTTRDQLRAKLLADPTVTVGPRTFTLTSARIERDASERYANLEVGMTVAAADNNPTVSRAALQNAIAAKANALLVDQVGAAAGTIGIKIVKLDAVSATTLGPTLTNP